MLKYNGSSKSKVLAGVAIFRSSCWMLAAIKASTLAEEEPDGQQVHCCRDPGVRRCEPYLVLVVSGGDVRGVLDNLYVCIGLIKHNQTEFEQLNTANYRQSTQKDGSPLHAQPHQRWNPLRNRRPLQAL